MPLKFRKKPVIVEAMQLTGDNAAEIILWAHEGLHPAANSIVIETYFCYQAYICLAVRTLEGARIAMSGDWIVKGTKGEFYPVKPDIFEETYEPD